ncbi:magnesium transporter, partial [Campylobacter lanienae]
AAFLGTFIPLSLKRIGLDPAVGSTVFLTTATDIIGFFVFLGLATWILL